MRGAAIVALLVGLAAGGLADLRWLRVAQREHYLAGSATRFALRWWLGQGPNRVLAVAAALGVILSPLSPAVAVVAAVAIGVGPFGLSLLGQAPAPLAWTRRMRLLAGILLVISVVPVAVGVLFGAAVPLAVLVAFLSPVLVDVSCAIAAPVEDHLAQQFVDAAAQRLRDVAPVIVAITGSYGKTTTKAYVAHLCATTRRVVATPASFNNRAGLSRAVNEHVVAGTEVFVAEMGTYGPGEIEALCAWCAPRVAAITAIGPVHLERFGTEAAIVAAKSEIFGSAEAAVLNVDDQRLAEVADLQEARGLKVWRCSDSDLGADVCVRRADGRLEISAGGTVLADVPDVDAVPGNVAVAVALALEVGVRPESIPARVATLPTVPNRRAVTSLSTGATAIDDTFNSNPAGWRAALETMNRLSTEGGKRVVVTPGMVEMGPRQREENAAFGAALGRAATHVVVVGWTNRRALVQGVGGAGPVVVVVDRHDDAVAWVRANTRPGDVVLYENQLPDHYP